MASRTKPGNDIVSHTDLLRNKVPDKVLPEVKYEGTSHVVPELGITVKVREGSTLRHWIARYIVDRPYVSKVLIDNYDITLEFLEENNITSNLVNAKQEHLFKHKKK